ncbi:cytochrome P450 6j1-like [Oppia nitens]|uniref:cytochrome P450 6j1-like n=1 Tax=Oppia nitens TaxID=1686743 RepID=UPI0023DAAA7D|nr:cytochrome P450 6j1-like [Oppia nitens]
MNLPENFSKQVLFQTSDSRWRQLRKIKAQVFTTKRLKFYYNIVDRCAQRFADHIEDMANGKQYIHLKDLYSKFTMDVSLKCSFSVQTSIYDNDQQTVQLWSSAHRLIHKLKCNELIARAPSYMQSMAKLFGFGYDKQFVDLENRLIDYIVARLQQSSSSNHNNDCDNDFVGVYLESGVLDKKDNKAICYYLLDLFFHCLEPLANRFPYYTCIWPNIPVFSKNCTKK